MSLFGMAWCPVNRTEAIERAVRRLLNYVTLEDVAFLSADALAVETELREALATPEPARADAAETECARLRDKYASGTFCPGCDHQRLARYEAEAARDREQARADALLAERDRLRADLARANARAEAWKFVADARGRSIMLCSGSCRDSEEITHALRAARRLEGEGK